MDDTLKQRLLEELPDVSDIESKKLRFVEQPKTELLTEDQLTIYNDMVDFIKSDSSMFLVQGYAGTGKTFLISMFIEYLLISKLKVCVTAPTNKAVQVLKNAAEYKDTNLDYRTVHSLLGLKEHIDRYGNQTFKQNNREDASIEQFDIIVVDEVSMLSDELLLGGKDITSMLDYMQVTDIKIIFVGDPIQIPPIGKEQCSVFYEEFREQNNLQVGVLNEIVRQSKGNPMIDLTLKIRKFIGRKDVVPVSKDAYDEQSLEGVYFVTGQDRNFFYKLLNKYFNSEYFERNGDYVKVIAWTNKAVDAFTNIIRGFIYGKERSKIEIGEKLIADKPICAISDMDTEVPSIFTNAEMEVISYEVKDGNYKGAEVRYYEALVNVIGLGKKTIRIIHEDSDEDFKLITSHLKELALDPQLQGWKATGAWKEYYAIFNVFAQVKYNYCITCHKAQGSTYQTAIVMESDIDRNRKIKEKNRIKYTAFTRPKSRLFICR